MVSPVSEERMLFGLSRVIDPCSVPEAGKGLSEIKVFESSRVPEETMHP